MCIYGPSSNNVMVLMLFLLITVNMYTVHVVTNQIVKLLHSIHMLWRPLQPTNIVSVCLEDANHKASFREKGLHVL